MISPRSDGRGPIARPISLERNGKTYEGTYTVIGGVISLSSSWGSKATPVGNRTTVSSLARVLLSEVIPPL